MSNNKQQKAIDAENELKARKRTKAMVIGVAAIIVILLVLTLTVNSAGIRRNATAIEVDGVKLSAAEVNYYYYSSYYNYVGQVYNYYASYAEDMLPTPNVPLKSQFYDEEAGTTWKDFFEGLAMDSITSVCTAYAEGQKNGFVMSDEQLASVDETITTAKESATKNGYKSFQEFLTAYYRKGMNEKIFHDTIYRSVYASAYSQSVNDALTYTQDQIDACYDENKDYFDTYTFRYFYIRADEVEENDDMTEEEINAAKAEVMADAKAKADGYAAGIKSEQDFINAARSFDAESYAEDNSTLRNYSGDILGNVYGEWLRDASRVNGDVGVCELENNGYYVVYFIGRDDNQYTSVDVYQLTLNATAVSESDYEDDYSAYEAAVAEANENVKNLAQSVVDSWTGSTKEEFANYASTVSSADVLFKDNIGKYNYTDEVDQWLFGGTAQEGEVKLFQKDDDTYYVFYFVGEDMTYHDGLADKKLREADYNSWMEELTANVTVNKGIAYGLSMEL